MGKVNVVMYHYVRPVGRSRYPDIKALETEAFIKQLDFFQDNGFHFIRMEELIEAFFSLTPLPDKAVLLTFDDGYADHYDTVFPILSNRGIQGSFFIPGEILDGKTLLPVNEIHYILASVPDHGALKTELLSLMDHYRGNGSVFPENDELISGYEKPGKYDDPETVFIKKMLQSVLPEEVRDQIADRLFKKYLGITKEVLASELYINEHQIRHMKKSGMFIGAHGYHHYSLASVPEEEMKEDILRGLQCLDEWIDRDSWVMNYPYGSYNEKTEEFIRSEGAKLAITTKVGILDTDKDDPFNIPRLNTNDFPPVKRDFV